jgi:ubiquinone/menaquinone biosynthesis C-methylase UbiE
MSDQTALPCSDACERNKAPILAILKNLLAAPGLVFEIGAGTGQHAVHFARHLPHLEWLPTDRGEWLDTLRERVRREGPSNLRAPIELDVKSNGWPIESADTIYSANTLHIMAWPEVEAFFRGVGRTLAPRGRLAVYGPFRFEGNYTSASNAEFDAYLRRHDAASGIRDLEAVDALAAAVGLQLAANYAMPANNQLVVWRKSA